SDTLSPNLAIVEISGNVATNGILKFRWLAVDDLELPSELSPNSIQYSYSLQGFDPNWSPWSARAFVDYTSVPVGTYNFCVVANDSAGNLSPTSCVAAVVFPTVPPLTCAANKTVECGSAWDFDPPTTTNICGPVTVTVVSTFTNINCGNTF